MRGSYARWSRFVIVWLILCLLVNGGLARSVEEYVARAIEALAERTISANTTAVDEELDRAGFSRNKQAQIADWDRFSPVRKIETAYWSAERARTGSGEDFLAKLASQLSKDHPRLPADERVKSFIGRQVGDVRFESLREPPASRPSNAKVRSAITAMATELDRSSLLLAEDLLRAGGMSADDVYDVLRASDARSRSDALNRAVEKLEPGEQTKVVRAMAQHFATHDGRGPRPVPPEVAELLRTTDPARVGEKPLGGDIKPDPDRDRGRRLDDGSDAPPARPRRPSPPPPKGPSLGGSPLGQPIARVLRPQGVEAGGGRLGRAIQTFRFVSKIGGVSFGEIATPAQGTRVGSMSLRYDAGRPDGQRVVATVAGKHYVLEIPDWIVIPAAAWSKHKDVAVLTGFGELADKSEERGCSLVFNYAPAIDGTLIGLRLMQSDVVARPAYVDLVMFHGKYVLGAGEDAPTPAEIATRTRAHSALKLPPFASYVLTDANRKFTFTLTNKRIVLSGQPVYRLWKTAADDWNPWVDDGIDDLAPAEIVKRANAAEKTLAARLAGGPIKLGWSSLTVGLVSSTANLARTHAAAWRGQAALRKLEHWVRLTTVILIPDAQNPLSDPKTIESLNPTVYSAVTRFAQLAAWFRYVQASHPRAWATFIKQVPPPTRSEPRVQLPTCMP